MAGEIAVAILTGMDANPEGQSVYPGEGAEISPRGLNQLGTTAAIAGVGGFILFFSFARPLGLFVAVCAALLGFVARSQARSHHLRTGMANAGIVSGLLLGALYPLILFLESIWPV
ncbi:MAG: hypothetical protein WBM90_05835 [Acidimicrobiia bacterium]